MFTTKCSACGCTGIHACIGRLVPKTKVGDAVLVNGIVEFMRTYCNPNKPSGAHSVASSIARYTNT